VIAQLPDPDRARKIDRFAELCELARPLGLTVDLEFPSWTETPDLRAAVRVLREADQPNAGILIDLLHFARSGSSVADLRQLPAEWFHFAHVCDAPPAVPPTNEGLIHTARFERLFPGEGGIDVHGILGALPAGLPYALEIPRATLVAQVVEPLLRLSEPIVICFALPRSYGWPTRTVTRGAPPAVRADGGSGAHGPVRA
jgi:sugar phosphate isomerase/epimerase